MYNVLDTTMDSALALVPTFLTDMSPVLIVIFGLLLLSLVLGVAVRFFSSL